MRYPSLEAVRNEAKETLIDKVESKLIELIEKGEPSAIYFFLKCQVKHRGCVERQEIAKSGPQDVKITITPAKALILVGGYKRLMLQTRLFYSFIF